MTYRLSCCKRCLEWTVLGHTHVQKSVFKHGVRAWGRVLLGQFLQEIMPFGSFWGTMQRTKKKKKMYKSRYLVLSTHLNYKLHVHGTCQKQDI